MGTIRFQNVSKQFGGQIVLADVTLELHSGQSAALVGANGAGKTTLFRLITGVQTPDTGTVTSSRGLEFGYLAQEPDVRGDVTLRTAVTEAFAELIALEQKLHALAEQMAAEHDSPELADHMAEYDRINARFEAAGGYGFEQRVDEILGGLGFAKSDYDLPVRVLSGGQKCRAALAKLLLQERQFLLLDEPTNHLDIDAVRWLEKFLANYHGGSVIISHDRYLLDRVAERTIEVANTQVTSYAGNYSRYVETRELHRKTQERQYEKDKAFIEKERAYIAKHLAGQRTRQAQGRRTRLERQLAAGELTTSLPGADRRAAALRFDDIDVGGQVGKEIVSVDSLAKAFGAKRLFANLSFSVYAGQRLGITGPNGTGKTTLLKILLGQQTADAGTFEISSKARVGYFAQEPLGLDPERTVIQEICSVRPDFLERDARSYAARFLFTGEDPFKRVGTLSGGEQSRVRFLKLILTAPDLLILDEPTNHLDIPSRETLEDALSEYPGTIITVSHDRYFLDRVVEQLLVMRPEGNRLYRGNYTDYIAQVEQEQQVAEAAAAAERAARMPARKQSRGGGAARQPGAPKTRFQRMKLPELEAFISEREAAIRTLQERFGDTELYRDGDRVTALQAELETLQAELAEAEAEWLARAEAE